MVMKKDALEARHITKVMQDQFQMLTSDYADQYHGDINSILALTQTMIGGADHERWLMWREVDINNIFDNLNTVLVPFLESVGESDMLELYKSYMTSTTKSMFEAVYPDLSNTVAYDITKARITPYVARIMLKYADDDFDVTQAFHQVAQLTAQGDLFFLEQSPDTRGETFAGAVMHEAGLRGPASFRSVTTYMIDFINSQLADGNVNLADVISCRSKDASSTANVSLYSGNCIENTYLNALGRSPSTGWTFILDNINSGLRSELAVRFARNVSGKQVTTDLKPFVAEKDKIRFLSAACQGMSTSGHQLLITELAEKLGDDLDSSVDECSSRMIANQDLLDSHLTHLTTFLCQQSSSDSCKPLVKCPSPARFAFNEWRLPESYEPEHYDVHLNLDGLKEVDKKGGFFHFDGESTATLKINEENICHITLHAQENTDLMYDIKHQLYVNDKQMNSHGKRNTDYWYYHILPDMPLSSADAFKINTEFTVKLVENP